MHFSSLVLALAAATAASAASVSKRSFYYPTFLHLNGATEASDYLTYTLVPTVFGNALALFFRTTLNAFPDCFLACDKVAGCAFVNSKQISSFQNVQR